MATQTLYHTQFLYEVVATPDNPSCPGEPIFVTKPLFGGGGGVGPFLVDPTTGDNLPVLAFYDDRAVDAGLGVTDPPTVAYRVTIERIVVTP